MQVQWLVGWMLRYWNKLWAEVIQRSPSLLCGTFLADVAAGIRNCKIRTSPANWEAAWDILRCSVREGRAFIHWP
jgi:hypothetical protein